MSTHQGSFVLLVGSWDLIIHIRMMDNKRSRWDLDLNLCTRRELQGKEEMEEAVKRKREKEGYVG